MTKSKITLLMNLNLKTSGKSTKTNPYSTYVTVGFYFNGYKGFHLHAYVDTGATSCTASPHIIPTELWEELPKPILVNIANDTNIEIRYVTRNLKVSMTDTNGNKHTFIIPTVYQQNTGMDFIFGQNFLKLYRPFTQDLYEIYLTPKLLKFKIQQRAFKQASPGFLDSIRKQKRGEIISKHATNPINITKLEDNLRIVETILEDSNSKTLSEVSDSKTLSEDSDDYFVYSIQRHNTIVNDLLTQACSENPLDENKNHNGLLAEIKLINPATTVNVKSMAYSPDDAVEINKQIQELLEIKVIRPSRSPHSSPCFLVQNHNEIKRGKKRLVINYKALNAATISDGYLLPNKETILTAIRGRKYFSTLDCKSGFWQIRLNENSKPLTAFSCPMGQYEWNVVPFGLKQAPGLFQRFMDNSFKEYSAFCAVYVDDILVFSKTLDEHYDHLETVLRKCIETGIILSKKKAEVAKTKINYLGFTISNGEIELQSHILENIKLFPSRIPDKKSLQRFLGILTYADQYIRKLAEWRKPLQRKLKKDTVWEWNDSDTQYVEKFKRNLKEFPKLHHPLPDEYLIIETDASHEHWAGVLKSRGTDNLERLCRYTSGSFKPAEINYHSNEKEVLAVKRTITKFKGYLASSEFLVRTDNKYFTYFLRTSIKDDYKQGRLIRWQQWFSHYKFNVEHLAGTHNFTADSLTREFANKPP
ncbi:putative enzymatic polyprotein [Rudbeckia flower distortion virus]|uniref:RNA-directed DNA polymerase n=1 Tax=Rudbeckia flower distortion virus TaxID=587370 RepID=B8Y871_9VIRU|nr:putative enzymatic polyprotein [Rudbeckia flower distortion virus]ACL36982.1 putative enzymatic polyprotein [Rudbeckia flower distortion virus]